MREGILKEARAHADQPDSEPDGATICARADGERVPCLGFMAKVMVGDGGEKIGGRGRVPGRADAMDVIKGPDGRGSHSARHEDQAADLRKMPPQFLKGPFGDGILCEPDQDLGVDLRIRGNRADPGELTRERRLVLGLRARPRTVLTRRAKPARSPVKMSRLASIRSRMASSTSSSDRVGSRRSPL